MKTLNNKFRSSLFQARSNVKTNSKSVDIIPVLQNILQMLQNKTPKLSPSDYLPFDLLFLNFLLLNGPYLVTNIVIFTFHKSFSFFLETWM